MMSWPKRGSRSVLRRCTLGAACGLLALAALTPFKNSHAGPAGGTSLQGQAVGATADAYGSEQRAEELYLDGVEKLEAGHSEVARQMFESVIGRYPKARAAELARRQLAEIYSAKFTGLDVSPAESTASITPSDVTQPETATQISVTPRGAAWDEELRRNAAVQSRLRLEAGDRVFFSSGSAELGGRARMALSAQARWLQRWNEFEAAIEGHADEPGSDQENVVLSLRRAEAVRQRLIEEGVDARRLAVLPSGRTLRVATCSESECRAQNRRVVTLVFTNGTRERLGLVDSGPRAPELEQGTTSPNRSSVARSSEITR
jgi:peptidoglycan-associated lipoprotein